jgi:hypothetical protein
MRVNTYKDQLSRPASKRDGARRDGRGRVQVRYPTCYYTTQEIFFKMGKTVWR